MIHLHISTSDGIPIYQQIVNQIKHAVASGHLAPGEELPPIRKLAEHLVVNANTVARAYRELEQAGVVSCQRGAGTHVLDRGSRLSEAEKSRILTDRVDALVSEARQMNVPIDEVVEMVIQRDAELSMNLQEKAK